MKKDECEQLDSQEIASHGLFKTETIEGQMIYLISTNYHYPQQTKNQFPLGSLQIYSEQNKQVKFYKGEMFSTQCLNQEIDWQEKYFSKIILALSMGGQDLRYSFKPTDDENPSEFDFTLKVTERIAFPGSKKTISSEVVILKVQLRMNPQPSHLDSIFSTMLEQNQRQNQKLKVLTENVTKLDKQRTELLVELERNTQTNKRQEADLQNKCVLLLNKKKIKIRELQQAREVTKLYKNNDIEDEINDCQKILNQVSRQQKINNESEVLSQVFMSQPLLMSSLFEPSLDVMKKSEKKGNNINTLEKLEGMQLNEFEVDRNNIDEDYFIKPRKQVK